MAKPTSTALAKLRSVVRLVPFNRIFHSVEMTLLIAVAASLDYVFDDLLTTQRLLVLMLIAAAITVIGHLVAILNSSRLR